MAAMAASLMCCGVAKCGSPAPKSTTSMPCARSLSASATTAMVAEGSMRLMRSVSFNASLVAVVMPFFSFSFVACPNPSYPKPQSGARLAAYRQGRVFHAASAQQLPAPALHRAAGLRHFAHQSRADVGVLVGRHHENGLQRGFEFAVHQRHLQF